MLMVCRQCRSQNSRLNICSERGARRRAQAGEWATGKKLLNSSKQQSAQRVEL